MCVIRVNQAMFSGAPHIDSYGSGKEVVKVKLPSISSGVGGEEGSKDDGDSDNKPPTFTNSQPPQLLDKQIPDLVTLSMLPKSQWQSLINLDIIKVCFFTLQICILLLALKNST